MAVDYVCEEARQEAKLVNAASLPAQSDNWAFAIVKAARRESLGIIKKRRICSEQILTNLKEIFAIKHCAKIISEQIFTPLLLIFTVI